ncbi:hypothetical protein CEXT_682761 [Caerostris extrusa]|uniref:Uncharacterized protein n=1 Tax=Caerostris extrusa TaxID=172846 RepID=A0AAV4R113_CAEEX|nr:hypothetical protein CEXT_682761 [Caerostris extrusa]
MKVRGGVGVELSPRGSFQEHVRQWVKESCRLQLPSFHPASPFPSPPSWVGGWKKADKGIPVGNDKTLPTSQLEPFETPGGEGKEGGKEGTVFSFGRRESNIPTDCQG